MKKETKIGWAGLMLGSVAVIVDIAIGLGLLALGVMVVKWAWGG